MVVVDVAHRLESSREPTQLRPLGGLGVGPLHDLEDAPEPLRGGRVHVRDLGVEFPTQRLTVKVEPGTLGIPVPGPVDVVQDAIGVGAKTHSALRRASRTLKPRAAADGSVQDLHDTR